MALALELYRSTIGKKAIMAVTGFIGFGFVIGHLVGNLQAFPFLGGAEAIDAYAKFLRNTHGLLWVARGVLLWAVVTHIVTAYQLWSISKSARPASYSQWDPAAATYASRTMRWSGPLLLLFIVYHLLHFTFGTVHPSFEEGHVYDNLVRGFQVWYVSAFYIVAMLALCLHLYHGIWSMFQSLGWNTARYDKPLKQFSAIFAILIALGNISIPVAVLTGIIHL